MASKKKTVLLSFDDDMLIDVRKVLFTNGITIQQFVTCVFHKLSLQDPSALNILNETIRFSQESMDNQEKEGFKKMDPRTLYEMFERNDFEKE